jgi:5-methylcytosine-specific restriction enzyme A
MRAGQLMASPYCAMCAAKGNRTRASDVDHIKPHRGDKKIFYDAANLQSLCHSCHSEKTWSETLGNVKSNAPAAKKLRIAK